MKKSRYLIAGVLFLFVQPSVDAAPDEWTGPKESVVFSNWSLNLSFGFTSYFGDLSQYDLELKNKLIHESKTAYGIKLIKQFQSLRLAGQVIYGGFKSAYRPEHSFETSLVEYSGQAGLDVMRLFNSGHSNKYGLEVFVGIGQLLFTTSISKYNDGLQTQSISNTGTPEFVYFFGTGLYVNLTDRVGFTSELSIRQVQNDNIDKYIKNGDFDYYSLFNVGISYRFGNTLTAVRDESRQKINNGVPVWR